MGGQIKRVQRGKIEPFTGKERAIERENKSDNSTSRMFNYYQRRRGECLALLPVGACKEGEFPPRLSLGRDGTGLGTVSFGREIQKERDSTRETFLLSAADESTMPFSYLRALAK